MVRRGARTRRWWRRGRGLSVCALAGLAATIGTTWAMAWWHASTLFSPRTTERVVVVSGHDMWSMERGWWLTGESVTLWYGDGLHEPGRFWGIRRPSAEQDRRRVDAGEVPSWAGLHRSEHPVEKLYAIAYGWPARCLWGRTRLWMPESGRGGVPMSRRGWWIVAGTGPSEKGLPLGAIWPGLVVNTAFFGAIAWAVVAGPPTIIRRSRLRRGRCGWCGYDLRGGGGGGCPECGLMPA